VRRGDHLGMVSEAQIVVGAQIQNMLAIAVGLNVDTSLLRAGDQALGLVQALRPEVFCLARE